MATTITWIYADRLKTNPERRHKVKGRSYLRSIDLLSGGTGLLLKLSGFSPYCSLVRFG
jgi:hypothetical protein